MALNDRAIKGNGNFAVGILEDVFFNEGGDPQFALGHSLRRQFAFVPREVKLEENENSSKHQNLNHNEAPGRSAGVGSGHSLILMRILLEWKDGSTGRTEKHFYDFRWADFFPASEGGDHCWAGWFTQD